MSMRVHPIIQLVLLFAVIGFIDRLVTQPIETLLIIIMTALVIYLVNNYMKTGRFLPGKITPAAKRQRPSVRGSIKKGAAGSRKHFPFQVIDGKKGKENGKLEKEQEPKTYQ
ncbi:MAG: hypothetical protein H0Z34_05470 [Brevibacillus sp.]|nr:hypothetical protein [Brevibacillus sp.]